MTKKFEEVRRGGLADLAGYYQAQGAPKGEVTVVIAPGTRKPVDDAELDRLLDRALKSSTVRDAANAVSAETGLPRKQVYTRALKLKPGIKKG
jgi:16S rRNA (cytidine1402-2'-O)-methyltransferase